MNKAFLLKGLLLLVVIWVGVWFVNSWASTRKASAELVITLIDEGDFEDLSQEVTSSSGGFRQQKIDEISEVLNRLDLRQREQLNESRATMKLFVRLSSEEKIYFLVSRI